MFGSKTETPFADWPKTTALDEGGFHVTGRYLHPMTPRRAAISGGLIGLLVFLLLVDSVREPNHFFAVVVIALIAWGIATPVLRSLMYKNLDIKVLPDKIMVGGRWGYKIYPRNVRMEFRVERHRKAGEETLAEQRSGQRQNMIYRQAVEAVLQYGERRVVLAEMREKDVEQANALAFRLQNICESQNEALRQMAEGQFSPIEPVTKPAGSGEFGPEPELR
jgi:hypothetical protein